MNARTIRRLFRTVLLAALTPLSILNPQVPSPYPMGRGIKGELLPFLRLLLLLLPLSTSTVSSIGGSGDWNTAADWSTGALAEANGDVVIDLLGDIVVTLAAGTHTIRSIQCQEGFVLSGGSSPAERSLSTDSEYWTKL
jgi:hypothetical protein